MFISLILFFWDKVFISLISTGVLLRFLGVVVAYYVSPRYRGVERGYARAYGCVMDEVGPVWLRPELMKRPNRPTTWSVPLARSPGSRRLRASSSSTAGAPPPPSLPRAYPSLLTPLVLAAGDQWRAAKLFIER